jgi:hypothetical protein
MTAFGTYQGASAIMRKAFDWNRSGTEVMFEQMEAAWCCETFVTVPDNVEPMVPDVRIVRCH